MRKITHILKEEMFDSNQLSQLESEKHVYITSRLLEVIQEKDNSVFENGFRYIIRISYKGRNFYYESFHPYVYPGKHEYKRVDGRKYHHLFKS